MVKFSFDKKLPPNFPLEDKKEHALRYGQYKVAVEGLRGENDKLSQGKVCLDVLMERTMGEREYYEGVLADNTTPEQKRRAEVTLKYNKFEEEKYKALTRKYLDGDYFSEVEYKHDDLEGSEESFFDWMVNTYKSYEMDLDDYIEEQDPIDDDEDDDEDEALLSAERIQIVMQQMNRLGNEVFQTSLNDKFKKFFDDRIRRDPDYEERVNSVVRETATARAILE